MEKLKLHERRNRITIKTVYHSLVLGGRENIPVLLETLQCLPTKTGLRTMIL
jgi:hypothetical protein